MLSLSCRIAPRRGKRSQNGLAGRMFLLFGALVLLSLLLFVPQGVDATDGPIARFIAAKCYGDNSERCGFRNWGYVMRVERDDGSCKKWGCSFLPIVDFWWECGLGNCCE